MIKFKHLPCYSSLFYILSLLHPYSIRGQVGDISDVNYPGWIPSDRVIPIIEVEATRDGNSGLWLYNYTLANGSNAEQSIEDFELRFNAPEVGAGVSSPPGWVSMFHAPSRATNPGASFLAEKPNQPGAIPTESSSQIQPGQELTGFSITNAYPPGYARTYVQGYAPVPYISLEDAPAPLVVPNDTTNSQRGWTLGPTLYTEVLTPGDDGLTTDNFLGWMNISDFATILIDPAPIALKFSVVGETVFPETFRAELNGVDVTATFLPGPPDGADRVGVFRLGDSPLIEGVNVIQTSIEGIEGFTGVRGVDIDVMRFRLDPECSVPQTIVCPS